MHSGFCHCTPDDVVYCIMSDIPAGAGFARQTMQASTVYLGLAVTSVWLTKLGTQSQSNCDADGFIFETQAYIRNWWGM
jgi:hypothetical protein